MSTAGWRHRTWQVGIVVVGVVAATEIRAATPTYQQRIASFPQHATIGRPAHLDGLDVTVVDVDGAKTIGADRILRPTEGVWVLVTVRLDALETPARLVAADLVDADGRSYAASSRFTQPMLTTATQPGIAVQGQIAFEVPVAAASSLRLRASRAGDTRLDRVTDVPLQIAATDVEAWSADGTELTLAKREVVP